MDNEIANLRILGHKIYSSEMEVMEEVAMIKNHTFI